MNKQKIKIGLSVLFGFSLIISLVAVFNNTRILGVKSNNPDKEKSNSGKSNQVVKESAIEIKLKGYEKATSEKKDPPSNNAALFKKNILEVVEDLNDLAISENSEGNVDVGEEIQEIAETEEEVVDDVVEIIEEIEGESKFKKFLIGADYKNLGSLRSDLVHNRNQIRKLTKATEKVQSEENGLIIQEQLIVLTQERERIKDVIDENESQFSILGWIRKYLSGYISEPLDTEAEEELLEEVVDVLDEEIIEELVEPDLELDQNESN